MKNTFRKSAWIPPGTALFRRKTGRCVGYALFILGLLGLMGGAQFSEYEVKAATIYNFLKYSQWPDSKHSGSDSPIQIVVLGTSPFGDAWSRILDKKIGDRPIMRKDIAEYDASDSTRQSLQNGHVLFVCRSEISRVSDILKTVQGKNVLTISEQDRFLESGGIINFLMEGNKVRFEINLKRAKEEQIKIDTAVLKLALRVIQE